MDGSEDGQIICWKLEEEAVEAGYKFPSSLPS